MSNLSTLSVTVQDKDFTVRPVSPGQATGSHDLLLEPGLSLVGIIFITMNILNEEDAEVEQQLTVIPRIGSLRKKSMIDYAFPELHQKVT